MEAFVIVCFCWYCRWSSNDQIVDAINWLALMVMVSGTYLDTVSKSLVIIKC